MGQQDFFIAQFAIIFKNYHRIIEENNYNEYCKSKGLQVEKKILSKEEIIEKYGVPPWELVNKIFEETNIPYKVNSPTGTRVDSSFTFSLKDRNNNFEISSKDLSTGEKVLMSLALAIYNTGKNVGKPELLLIDEPDAGLHPSMSRMMINILKKNIVEENNIPTIITTHSPTTVIATEGISIYQLERGNNIPQKIPAQTAVENLSSDIPFLKISTEKRRQVFVESKYDVRYYELLSNIFARYNKLNSEPIFIPARTSDGSNCTDVIELVKNLFSSGNDQIYGIIDWDKSNKSNDRILVLGEDERYAIENYLLDPLLVGILMIRERELDINEFETLSIQTYSEINNLIQSDAQKIINKVLGDLGLLTTNMVKYKLLNNWELEISKEYNHYQGHELERLFKEKYPFFNIYNREDAFKRDVIDKVINDYPLLIPCELFKVLENIQ